MIVKMRYNEYLVTKDKREIEIFFRDTSVGIVNVSDIKNGVYNELIDAHFSELQEIVDRL